MEQIALITITADHVFDTVVRQKAFANVSVGRLWAEALVEQLLKQAKEDDPTFDDYGYTIRDALIDFDGSN